VTANHVKPAVANMSLGGGGSQAVDDAVQGSIDAGVTYAVAAGNDGRDACSFSPARAPQALTIGATDKTDTRPRWSNWGNCVDWFAPGVGITSANLTGTATWSGTSMASPHTAGAAALYLDANETASPAAVRAGLSGALTTGIVVNSKTLNNHLLYTGSDTGGGGEDPPDDPPGGEDPPSGDFPLQVVGTKTKGVKSAQLTWTYSGLGDVDVYRDGAMIATTANTGSYTDVIGKGGGSHTYQVCDGATCSNTATVTF
jgi:serine protease